MRKWLALLLVVLLSACAAQPESDVEREPSGTEESEAVSQKVPPVIEMYFPPDGQTPEEVVEAYFEEQYWAYRSLIYVDLSTILDMEQNLVASSAIWSQKLIQRRRLLKENDLCYVETEQFPYSIHFIGEEELDDVRLEYWEDRRPEKDDEVTLHFVITGEQGRAYPPQMALNAQHSMRLRSIDGQWKISFLYFPGSYRKYLRANNQEIPTDEETLAELRDEFRTVAETGDSSIPVGKSYDGDAAAAYALQYTENANDAFYHIGDWMGNCANFTSQGIWAGFLDESKSPTVTGRVGMTEGWYAGEGGGSPAWENVERFWEYITSGAEMAGLELQGIGAARPGDLLQTSSLVWEPDEDEEDTQPEDRYNHSLIVVDADRLLLAQHSPGCFVYYSDMPGLTTRLIRPTALNS